MANWRSNPIVGVVAVLLIGLAGFFIYRQVAPKKYGKQSQALLQYQAEIAAGEAKKLLPAGGKTVVIVHEGEMDEAALASFQKAAEGSPLQVVVYKQAVPQPGAEGEEAPPMDPMMMSPEMEGIKAVMEALKQHKDAKLVVTFLGLSLGMMGQDVDLPPVLSEFLEGGGKVVVVGGGGMPMMMEPGQEDPLMEYVEQGQIVMITHKPSPDVDPKLDPTTLNPEEHFETYMMVVDKENVSEYKDQLEKQMQGPSE